MAHQAPGLRLVRERKLAALLSGSTPATGVLEASGVVVKDGHFLVVFDTVRRVARIGSNLEPGSADHAWVGRLRDGEGYEDIAYSASQRRFYALIEAEKHPDGTYKAIIEEYDAQYRFTRRRPVNVPFEKRNRGFEG